MQTIEMCLELSTVIKANKRDWKSSIQGLQLTIQERKKMEVTETEKSILGNLMLTEC